MMLELEKRDLEMVQRFIFCISHELKKSDRRN